MHWVRSLVLDEVPSQRQIPYIHSPEAVAAIAAGTRMIWSFRHTQQMFGALAARGFLPFADCPAGLVWILLGKQAERRCLLEFGSCRISKKARKAARKRGFQLIVNSCFEEIMSGCIKQHAASWLHPPMQALLRSMWAAREHGEVRLLCFGLRDPIASELVAGELGYAIRGMA